MALVECFSCEKEISDKGTACPHCGSPVGPQITCPGCGEGFAASLAACPGCGCPAAIKEGPTKDKIDGGVKVFHTSPVLFWFLGVTLLGLVVGGATLRSLFVLYPPEVLYRPWTLLSHVVFPLNLDAWFSFSSSMVVLTLLGSYRLSLSRQLTALVIGTLVGALTFTLLTIYPFTGHGFAVYGFAGFSLVFGIKYWHRLRWYSRAVTIWLGVLGFGRLLVSNSVMDVAYLAAFWATSIISAIWLVPYPVKSLADEN